MELPTMGWKFKIAAKHYYNSWVRFGIEFVESLIEGEYHIKKEQTNIQTDGRYVTNSNSKLLFIFKACRMGTKFKISTILCVVGMKYEPLQPWRKKLVTFWRANDFRIRLNLVWIFEQVQYYPGLVYSRGSPQFSFLNGYQECLEMGKTHCFRHSSTIKMGTTLDLEAVIYLLHL